MRGVNGPKIVIVGGGSYTWCPRLLSDLIQTPDMEGSEIILLDPVIEAALEIQATAEKLAKTFGKEYRFLSTSSEEDAFRGADFVIITITTGGLDMMAHDLAIPESYGIYQTVGDSVGPGGWSRSLRNVPVFVHLAQEIEKHSPRAVVLNYTNPMGTLTGALVEASSLRTVGLCHGVFENYLVFKLLFDAEEEDLSVRFGGVNHFFWILDFAVRGDPGYPLLRKKLGDESLNTVLHRGTVDLHGFHSHHALFSELYEQYGYMTYVGDRHTCEYLPGYLTPTPDVLDRFQLKRTSVEARRTQRVQKRQYALNLAAGKEPAPKRSRETAVDITRAIAYGRPFFDVVNLPNDGQIDSLPRGAIVETLGLVDQLGFRPVASGSLAPVIQQLVEPHCICQLMTLEAAITGDRELALQALMIDPLCSHLPPSDVRTMGMELMGACQEWLPQFK